MDDAAAAAMLADGPGIPTASLSHVEHHFGDRPDVLEAIRELRRQKATYARIATLLKKHTGIAISKESVAGWLSKQDLSGRPGESPSD